MSENPKLPKFISQRLSGETYPCPAVRPGWAQQLIETERRIFNTLKDIAVSLSSVRLPVRAEPEQDWITDVELVRRIGGKVTTLSRYRSEGKGPPCWTKGPGGILYFWPGCQKWLANGGNRGPTPRHRKGKSRKVAA